MGGGGGTCQVNRTVGGSPGQVHRRCTLGLLFPHKTWDIGGRRHFENKSSPLGLANIYIKVCERHCIKWSKHHYVLKIYKRTNVLIKWDCTFPNSHKEKRPLWELQRKWQWTARIKKATAFFPPIFLEEPWLEFRDPILTPESNKFLKSNFKARH